MGLSSLVSRIIPAAVGAVTGGPVGAFAAITATEQQKRQERRQKEAVNAYNQQVREENKRMAEIFSGRGLSSIQAPINLPATQQAGFGAGFGNFLSDVGRNIVSPISGLFGQIAPFINRGEVQQPAVTTTRRIGAQESQTSGTSTAFIGGPSLGPAIQAARQFLRTPTGQVGTGFRIVTGKRLVVVLLLCL